MRRRFSREQWSAWIAEQARSTLSVRAFCRQKNIGEKSFYLWRQKLSDSPANGSVNRTHASKADKETQLPPMFVPVAITNSNLPTSSLEIDLPCGATIRLPGDEIVMRMVLGTLMELGRSQ